MSLNPNGININLTKVQSPTTGNASISSGTRVGTVFDGKGTDFLSPKTIQNKTDKFSTSITPISSNTLTNQLTGGLTIRNNADASRVLGSTDRGINNILSKDMSNIFPSAVPVIPMAGGLVPDLGINPDAAKITLFTDFFAQTIQPAQPTMDPRNFNPLQWINPTATNITLGSLQGQANVLNGTGLQFPAFSPFASQAVVNFPFNPLGSGLLNNVGGLTGLGNGTFAPGSATILQPLNGTGLQPTNIVDSSGVIQGTGLTFNGLGQGNVLSQLGLQTAGSPSSVQAFILSGSQGVQSYPDLVSLLNSMMNQSGALTSQMMGQLVQGYGTNAPSSAYAAPNTTYNNASANPAAYYGTAPTGGTMSYLPYSPDYAPAPAPVATSPAIGYYGY